MNYLRPMDRIARIQAFLEQNPKDSFLRHALALEYIKLGQLNDAKTLFLAVLTDNPDYVGSYYHLAKLLETLEERDAAIQWYEKGLCSIFRPARAGLTAFLVIYR